MARLKPCPFKDSLRKQKFYLTGAVPLQSRKAE